MRYTLILLMLSSICFADDLFEERSPFDDPPSPFEARDFPHDPYAEQQRRYREIEEEVDRGDSPPLSPREGRDFLPLPPGEGRGEGESQEISELRRLQEIRDEDLGRIERRDPSERFWDDYDREQRLQQRRFQEQQDRRGKIYERESEVLRDRREQYDQMLRRERMGQGAADARALQHVRQEHERGLNKARKQRDEALSAVMSDDSLTPEQRQARRAEIRRQFEQTRQNLEREHERKHATILGVEAESSTQPATQDSRGRFRRHGSIGTTESTEKDI